MPSLTPAERNEEATNIAMTEGLKYGLMTLIPSSGAVYWAMKNSPRFLARTNMQSRTALAIMPALFMFAFTSEETLRHTMDDIAAEEKHRQVLLREFSPDVSKVQTDAHLLATYRKSVEDSGVRIVPGELSFHHKASNYVATNPLKTLIALAVPSVGMIFYGRTGKEHLQLSMKLLHTRVFGQFATLSLLLGVMGFKEYMDSAGKYITEQEADERVAEMVAVRQSLLQRLEYEQQEAKKQHDKLVQAHRQDVEEKHERAASRHHHHAPAMAAMSPK